MMKPQTIVFALDGLDFEFAMQKMQTGELPNLKTLFENSWRSRVQTSLPAVSPSIWNTMLTGVGAGRHGVVDLVYKKSGTYGLLPCGGAKRLVPTLLGHLTLAGKQVACIGFPGTYPPERNGALIISGFDAPWAGAASLDAIEPVALRSTVKAMGQWTYNSFNEVLGVGKNPADWDFLARRLVNDLHHKMGFLTELYQLKQWDVFLCHLQTLDTAAHHFWHLEHARSPLHPSNRPAYKYLSHLYAKIDQEVGQFLELLPSHAQIMVVSDHGMGGSSGLVVYLNRILEHAGLLRFNEFANQIGPYVQTAQTATKMVPSFFRKLASQYTLPKQVSGLLQQSVFQPPIDWTQTSVWAQEIDATPALHFNVSGRDPQGLVRTEELDDLYKQLRSLFLQLRDPYDGTPVFQGLHKQEQVYSGPASWYGADLLLEYAWKDSFYRASVAPGWGMGNLLEIRPYAGGKGWGMPGVHRGPGVLWVQSEQLQRGEAEHVMAEDVGALLCSLAQVKPPASIDGQNPDGFQHLAQEQSIEADYTDVSTHSAYSAQEIAEIQKQLAHFGYIE